MLVVRLVEEDIFPVALSAFLRPFLEITRGGDAVLGAEFLPELWSVHLMAKLGLEQLTWCPTIISIVSYTNRYSL